MSLGEPVRGGFPEPRFASLPGIERARAYQRGLVPKPPLWHLTGIRATHIAPGSATCTMPAGPALRAAMGELPIDLVAASALSLAGMTGVSAGHELVMTAYSLQGIRMATIDETETVAARARVVQSGRNVTYTEASIEDAQGRQLASVSASSLLRRVEPPPPPAGFLDPVPTPKYSTPDPYERPVTEIFPVRNWDEHDGATVLRGLLEGTFPQPRIWALLGVRFIDDREGRWTAALGGSGWLCEQQWIQEGILAWCAQGAGASAALWFSPKGYFAPTFGQSMSLIRTVKPDGREVVFRARVTHRVEDRFVVEVEVTDADGDLVAVFHETAHLMPRPGVSVPSAERRLATVLYTDIVSSTEQTSRMGDDRWRQLLDEHHTVVRRQLQLHAGREIKTMGDGFLVTFESAAQAVRCADAIQEGVWPLGLEIRAGVHTGEVEFDGGDISGIAATIAKRVQDAAGPGEVLVSSTVRDVVAGSGLEFAQRGAHELKGVPGTWELYEVMK